jgi:cyclophilin family peptidyl-prolyl cis-trans isomerase
MARALRGATSSGRDPRLAALVASPDHLTRLAAIESAEVQAAPAGLTEVALLAALSGTNGPEVATAATSLAKWPLPSAAGPVAASLGRFAADPDPAVPAALLDALAALAVPATEPAIRPLLASPAPSVRSAAVRALLALGITASPAPPPLEPAPWLTATSNTGIRVELEKGAFVIALDRDDAPAHARVLSTLADQGYFDGRAFHRVVANFVIQGGNDGDDGWGGPGFTLRCQVSPTPYVRGTVGMSLSGKDTGGAEFFVAHGAFPHLEGRYTVVGRVVQGMDVVDRILPGDRMLRVRPVP